MGSILSETERVNHVDKNMAAMNQPDALNRHQLSEELNGNLQGDTNAL